MYVCICVCVCVCVCVCEYAIKNKLRTGCTYIQGEEILVAGDCVM